jgi:hypothetical protein
MSKEVAISPAAFVEDDFKLVCVLEVCGTLCVFVDGRCLGIDLSDYGAKRCCIEIAPEIIRHALRKLPRSNPMSWRSEGSLGTKLTTDIHVSPQVILSSGASAFRALILPTTPGHQPFTKQYSIRCRPQCEHLQSLIFFVEVTSSQYAFLAENERRMSG